MPPINIAALCFVMKLSLFESDGVGAEVGLGLFDGGFGTGGESEGGESDGESDGVGAEVGLELSDGGCGNETEAGAFFPCCSILR